MAVGETLALIAVGTAVAVLVAIIRDRKLEDRIMGKTADALADVTEKIEKIKTEFTGELADLRAQLDAKGTLDDADVAALDSLHAKLNELDDLVADVPVEEPGDPDPELPLEPPTDEVDPPHPDNTLPGDLPAPNQDLPKQ